MYGWLWRHAPGPWWVRVFLFAAAAAAVLVICFTTFFPWVSPLLPFNNVTVDDPASPPPASPTPTQSVEQSQPAG
ncbi:MAG: hypothetical protein LBJ02_08485 [Bifidobacteriaceae bacterium]|jgi:hypothetical protein|nr:hypothetical protein [Bifidobacteriaceae bacterium]